ncbi:MAG: metallophosphoesterase [Euryarchaeota archaeon]|nr:MAG: hypothetical protein C5S47_04705 [ANME-2 cluster archaeon]MEA1864347.1 metallophosphoesterase [Euryarchaeota archaeon]
MARLIISDIHADIDSLNAIIEIIEDPSFTARYGDVTGIINLGDAVGRGFHPIEVIERLLELSDEKEVISVVGNHDEAFLSNQEISGSDIASIEAHSELREDQRCMRFLKSLPQHSIDHDDRILAVHGGPIEPSTISDGASDDRLYSHTWQRISDAGNDFLDDTAGYHYTPEHAFAHVDASFSGGFLILCGHEHYEACYSAIGGKIRDILKDMIRRMEVFSGRSVRVRSIMRQEDVSYLVRVGIAGPEGFSESAEFGTAVSHFGLLWEHKSVNWVGLCSFEM